MIISKLNSTNFQAKYIPLSEHKGPILKLTEEETKRVLNLNSRKDQLKEKLALILKEIEKISDSKVLEKVKLCKIRNQLYEDINFIDKNILEIKKNRIRLQKKEAISKNI